MPIFEDLIADKWHKFARSHHIIWHLMPHYLIAAAYMCLLTMRVPALYACRFGEEFPGMRWPGDEDELNAAQMWLSPVLLGATMPFLGTLWSILEHCRAETPRPLGSKETFPPQGHPTRAVFLGAWVPYN